MLFLIAVVSLAGAQYCLDDAIPTANRKYLDTTTLTGNTIDGSLKMKILGFTRLMEMPHGVFSDALKILFEEKIGVHVEYAEKPTPYSNEVVKIVAGCKVFDTAGECDMDDDTYRGERGHWMLGYWKSYAPSINDLPVSQHPAPLWSGSHGVDGMFVKETQVNRAKVDKIDLTWISNFNIPAQRASAYYTTALADLPRPINCTDVLSLQPDSAAFIKYVEVTGDSTGGMDSCVDGWWFSTACRATPADCIPVLTSGNGWSVKQFAQYSFFFDMPLAIGTVSWGDYVKYGASADAMLYWWWPDMTFSMDLPTAVMAPPRNPAEQAAGIWKTANSKDLVMLAKWPGLQKMDRAVWQTLEKFLINDYDVLNAVIMLKNKDPHRHYADGGGGDSTFLPERWEVACEWLKANDALWKSWIPDKTACEDGEGVYTLGSNSFCLSCPVDLVSTIGDNGVRTCGECPAGQYNEDGQCNDCHRGTYNDLVGAKECKTCSPGTYGTLSGAKTAAETCVDCGAGTYALQPGSSFCPPCPSGTIDAGTGKEECTPCPAGQFSTAAADGMQKCQACPEGHFCAEKTADPVPCEIGHYAGEGAESCTRCPARTYGDLTGAAECKTCQPEFTSPPGSTVFTDCVCPQGTYYAANVDKCTECITGMVCVGGRNIPFTAEGYYGEAADGTWEGVWELKEEK